MNDWLSKVLDHPSAAGCAIIAAKTLIIYGFLIVGLRLLGKRELGQMNIYDLVLIIVLGNSVQNAMMNNDNSLGGGLVAATTLLLINRVFNSVMLRNRRLARTMVGQPVLILNHGQEIEAAMRHEGISHEQIMQALREHGMDRPSEAHSCVLEVDGTITVIPEGAEAMRTKHHFKALRLP